MIESIFKKLNLEERDHLVFTTLYKLGANPASIVAKHCSLERTTTYRILKKLNKLGLVSVTERQGIQTFFIEDEKAILKFIQRRKNELEDIEEDYQIIESELKNLRPEALNPPQIKIYDQTGIEGSKQIFNDILDEIKRQKLITIRLLASDTFSEKTGPYKLKDLADLFLKNLEKNNVKVDALVAEGMLTRERLLPLKDKLDLLSLPASNGASHIYLIGDTVFIILFRENTIGLKISHPDIAQTWHFVFDQLQKKN